MRAGPLREVVNLQDQWGELVAQNTFEDPADPGSYLANFNCTFSHDPVEQLLIVTRTSAAFGFNMEVFAGEGFTDITPYIQGDIRYLDIVFTWKGLAPAVQVGYVDVSVNSDPPGPEMETGGTSGTRSIGQDGLTKEAVNRFRASAPGTYRCRFDLREIYEAFGGLQVNSIFLTGQTVGVDGDGFDLESVYAQNYDKDGQPWGAWYTVGQVPMAVVPKGSREYERRALHKSDESTLLRCRWRDDINTRSRIVWRGDIYQVEAPPVNVDARRRELYISVRKIG